MNTLVSVETASEWIRRGIPLSLAGTESVLDQLPAGNWIAGTIPYFMTEKGGVESNDHVFATQLPSDAVHFDYCDSSSLRNLVSGAPENGFSIVIIPASSIAHRRFAEEGRHFDGIFLKPIIGWISGVALSNLGSQMPKIYDGRTRTKHADGAVVAHVTLPPERLASIEIVNIFEKDNSDVLRFSGTGFSATTCTVNGRSTMLANYLVEHGNGDGKAPLVGDFSGASINVSVQSIDPQSGEVKFYAPVFPDVEYHLARPVADYAGTFSNRLAIEGKTEAVFSCNCILNFVYGSLEGKSTGSLFGPITFGEIAYQLLNQTMVVLRIV